MKTENKHLKNILTVFTVIAKTLLVADANIENEEFPQKSPIRALFVQ